jgi:hypothetical protein
MRLLSVTWLLWHVTNGEVTIQLPIGGPRVWHNVPKTIDYIRNVPTDQSGRPRYIFEASVEEDNQRKLYRCGILIQVCAKIWEADEAVLELCLLVKSILLHEEWIIFSASSTSSRKYFPDIVSESWLLGLVLSSMDCIKTICGGPTCPRCRTRINHTIRLSGEIRASVKP